MSGPHHQARDLSTSESANQLVNPSLDHPFTQAPHELPAQSANDPSDQPSSQSPSQSPAESSPLSSNDSRSRTLVAQALTDASTASWLLVATDFDGVLAPLALDPIRSTPLPGTIESLRALAALPRVHVAVVSGRDLSTLRALTGIEVAEPITLIGSHGAESSSAAVRSALGSVCEEDAGQEDARLLALRGDLSTLITGQHPEARLEFKTAAVVVLTRGLATGVAAEAIAAAREVGHRHPGVKAITGKDLLEFSFSHADKGSAVTALGREHEASARIYFGDDVTDEDVFTQLTLPTDVTIKVGPGPTAARYRLTDEAAVAQALRLLVETTSTRSSAGTPHHTG